MKPNTQTMVTSTTTFENATTRDMSIRAEDFAHLAKLVTDIYSDAALAVVREYSANASDSHMMSGQTRPIEITTPNTFRSTFSVQDFGEGLSVDEILDVYGQYGASSKRERDDAVGMFGIGSKSALSYTNSFTVTGVKNGVKAIVMFERKPDGTGKMTVLDTRSTDECNGVLVDIPVNDRTDFKQKCAEFFRFWPKGKVLVNGVEPETHELSKVADATINFKDGDNNDVSGPSEIFVTDADRSYVVMGNVPYPVTDTLYDSAKFLARVPIGSLAITPSREELYYNPLTKDTIAQVKKAFDAGLVAVAIKEIQAATSFRDAWDKRVFWTTRVGRSALDNVKYQGQDVPTNFSLPGDANFTVWLPGAYHRKVREESRLNMADVYASIIVTGYNVSHLSTTHRAKIKKWEDDNSIDTPHAYIFVNADPSSQFLTGVPRVSFSDIKNVVLPSQGTGGNIYGGGYKAIPGSWDRFDSGAGYKETVEITTLDATEPIVYVSGSDEVRGTHSEAWNHMPDNVQFLKLGRNRWDKFKKQFPQAVHVRKYAQAHAQATYDAFTPDELLRAGMDYRAKTLLGKLSKNGAVINDPAIAHAIKVAAMPDVNQTEWNKARRLATMYYMPCPEIKTTMENLFDNYPLINNYSSHITDIILYINAKYDACNPAASVV